MFQIMETTYKFDKLIFETLSLIFVDLSKWYEERHLVIFNPRFYHPFGHRGFATTSRADEEKRETMVFSEQY